MTTEVRARHSPLKHWSAWLPVALSVFFIALALRHVAIYGPGIPEDAYPWLPKSPWLALALLAVQLVAAGGVFALVYWLEHA